MPHSSKHRNVCIAINLIGLITMAEGYVDLGAVILFAGLMKFETYMLARHYENKR
jgi:hypothetical protein